MTRLKEKAQQFRLPRSYQRCQSCRHFRKSLTDGVDFVNGDFCCHLPDVCPPARKSTVKKQFRVMGCKLYGKRDPDAICYIGEVAPFVGEV
jgi:hypothetical protein